MRIGLGKGALTFGSAALIALATACSGGDDVKGVAAELEANAERSGQVMKDTYEKDRAEGEGRIEAAGDAYNAVVDEGREREREKEAKEAGVN